MTTKLSDCHYANAIVSVMKNTDPVAALVHGYVRYWCERGGSGKCWASHERMAKFMSVSRYTVLRKLKLLCEKGYLVDQTPGLRNKPHTYTETGLAGEQERARIAAIPSDDGEPIEVIAFGGDVCTDTGVNICTPEVSTSAHQVSTFAQ